MRNGFSITKYNEFPFYAVTNCQTLLNGRKSRTKRSRRRAASFRVGRWPACATISAGHLLPAWNLKLTPFSPRGHTGPTLAYRENIFKCHIPKFYTYISRILNITSRWLQEEVNHSLGDEGVLLSACQAPTLAISWVITWDPMTVRKNEMTTLSAWSPDTVRPLAERSITSDKSKSPYRPGVPRALENSVWPQEE